MERSKPQQIAAMNVRQRIRRAIIVVSFLVFPITLNYFSPYIIIDGASQGIIAGSFITFSLLFLVSLFLGRAWCGWVCPGAGVQEWCFTISNKAVRGGKLNWIKYGIWVPWIGSILFVAVSAGGFSTVNPLHNIETGISVAEPNNYIMYFTVVALFVVLAFAAGRRAFCHYLCWMAPFVILGAKIKSWLKWPSLHLATSGEQCKQCRTCDTNCPMSLVVSSMVQAGSMENTECIVCGTCVDNCPNGVIKFALHYDRKPQRQQVCGIPGY